MHVLTNTRLAILIPPYHKRQPFNNVHFLIFFPFSFNATSNTTVSSWQQIILITIFISPKQLAWRLENWTRSRSSSKLRSEKIFHPSLFVAIFYINLINMFMEILRIVNKLYYASLFIGIMFLLFFKAYCKNLLI